MLASMASELPADPSPTTSDHQRSANASEHDDQRPRTSRRTAFAAGAAGLVGYVGLRNPEPAAAADLLDGRAVDLSGMTTGQAVALGAGGTLRPTTVGRALPVTVVSSVTPGTARSAALQAELQAFDPTTGASCCSPPGSSCSTRP